MEMLPERKNWERHVQKCGDPQTAWSTSERGDQMAMAAAELAGPPWGRGRKRLVLALSEVDRAFSKLKWWEATHLPEEIAIQVVLEWARESANDPSREPMRILAHCAPGIPRAVGLAAVACLPEGISLQEHAASVVWLACADAAYRPYRLRVCARILRSHYPFMPQERWESR